MPTGKRESSDPLTETPSGGATVEFRLGHVTRGHVNSGGGIRKKQEMNRINKFPFPILDKVNFPLYLLN